MKRKLRETLRRILSIVLMIVMLPLSSLQPAFTAIVHAEGTDEYVAETPVVIEEEMEEGDTVETPSEDIVAEEIHAENEDVVSETGEETVNEDAESETGEETVEDEDADSETGEESVVGEEKDLTEENAIVEDDAEVNEDEAEVTAENAEFSDETEDTEENVEDVTIITAEGETIEETDYPRLANEEREIVNLELDVVINESCNSVLEWK